VCKSASSCADEAVDKLIGARAGVKAVNAPPFSSDSSAGADHRAALCLPKPDVLVIPNDCFGRTFIVIRHSVFVKSFGR
jgi:hypothetical protein